MKSVVTITISTSNDDTQVSVRIAQRIEHSVSFDAIQDWMAVDRLSHDAITAYQNALREHKDLHPKEHAALLRA